MKCITLSQWMEWRGLTDEQFAELVGVDRTAINRIKRGVNRPSWELAARIKVATEGAVTADSFLPEVAA
jgi:DNA-binding XRE family transcriptional regulator